MIPLNYHHLYYFWTVARAGSIAAATERLYLSQPALSGQIKQLEQSCRTKLLERSRKGVSLTYEGRVIFDRCERIFSEGEELAALMKNGLKAEPVLRVGIQPAVSREAVLRALDFAQRTDKTCRTTLLSGELESLCAKLRRQAIDLIIANEDCAGALGKDYRSKLVGQLPVYFVANRTVGRLIRRFPSDLTKTAMLLRSSGNSVRRQVDQFLSRKGVRCRIEADSEDVDLLRRMALEGRGVAALSALSVERDLKSGRLTILHRSPLGIFEQIWFAYGPHPNLEPATRRVINALAEDFSLQGRAPALKSSL